MSVYTGQDYERTRDRVPRVSVAVKERRDTERTRRRVIETRTIPDGGDQRGTRGQKGTCHIRTIGAIEMARKYLIRNIVYYSSSRITETHTRDTEKDPNSGEGATRGVTNRGLTTRPRAPVCGMDTVWDSRGPDRWPERRRSGTRENLHERDRSELPREQEHSYYRY